VARHAQYTRSVNNATKPPSRPLPGDDLHFALNLADIALDLLASGERRPMTEAAIRRLIRRLRRA
jgi:hypothetical protein